MHWYVLKWFLGFHDQIFYEQRKHGTQWYRYTPIQYRFWESLSDRGVKPTVNARDYIIVSLFVCISCLHLNVSTHLHASASHRVVKLISTSRSCMSLLNAPPYSPALLAFVPSRQITIPWVRKIENRSRSSCHLQPTITFAPLNREFVKNSSLTAREEARNFINIQHRSDFRPAISASVFSAEIANCESPRGGYEDISSYLRFLFNVNLCRERIFSGTVVWDINNWISWIEISIIVRSFRGLQEASFFIHFQIDSNKNLVNISIT